MRLRSLVHTCDHFNLVPRARDRFGQQRSRHASRSLAQTKRIADSGNEIAITCDANHTRMRIWKVFFQDVGDVALVCVYNYELCSLVKENKRKQENGNFSISWFGVFP